MTLLLAFLAYAIALSIALGRAGHRSSGTPATGDGRPRPRRVLVVGATGGTGRRLVAQALERGLEVTALVRDPSRLDDGHPRLRVVAGNILDPAAVGRATAGQDAVLCSLGHKRFLGPTRILSEGTRNLLASMAEHGVRRLICVTSLGIGDSAGRMGLPYTLFTIPLVLPFYFWDKTRQERLIAASGLDWVIVRPGALTGGEPRDRRRIGHRVGSFLWTVRVPRADVAAFMLDQLESDDHLRTATGIA